MIIAMKRFAIILLIASALFTSCGVANQTASTIKKSIPATFFNCTLGSTESIVLSKMDRQDYYSNWRGIPAYKVLPLGKRKIKSQQTFDRVAYGGFTWQETTFLFDFRDRFFCIAFLQDFSNPDNARARYNDVKATLDGKYGIGQESQYGVVYGNPDGKCIRLAVVPVPEKSGAMCGLYYMDDTIYKTDTADATDEL